MSDEPKPEEKKIFVDEDWKSRVQAEKQAAQQEQAAEKPPMPECPPESDQPPPPPSLTVLASSLYLQGLVGLGLLPDPRSQKPEVHLDQARHAADMLQMLCEKTEGNRTDQETKELDTMLHELRLAFVSVQNEQGRSE